MARLVLLLILVWGLFGLSALCTAGTLLHDCEYGAVIGCAHEEQCSDDPCTEVLALPDTSFGNAEALPEVSAMDSAPPTGNTSLWARLDLPEHVNLPFPSSQRPLLI